MSILAPGKADYDNRISALVSDFRTGESRAVDLLTQWSALGQAGQEALGYSADDIAQVTAFLSFCGLVEGLYSQVSPYNGLTYRQLLQLITPFVLPR